MQRYRIATYEVVEDDAGEWVRYCDVRAEIERLTEELQQVRSENGNAFVAGASWQLYVSTGFTQFGSEARAAEVEAQRRGYDFRPSIERMLIDKIERLTAANAALTARLAEATELLRAVEWSSDKYHAGPNACPVCTGLIPYTAEPTDDWPETFRGGHGAHCRLAAWLAAQSTTDPAADHGDAGAGPTMPLA